MKIAKKLLPLLLIFVLALFFVNNPHINKTDVEKAVTNELDLLKNLDSETAKKYISYQELFPDSTEPGNVPTEIEDVFSLFFKDFSYKIRDIDVERSGKAAVASVRLNTLDAKALAKDFVSSKLKNEILSAADSREITSESDRLSESYLLLKHLLKTQKYETTEHTCDISLVFNEDTELWEIKRTASLENNLVGGLITYLSDPDILSPEDTLALYLKTLKKMNLEEMSNFLCLETLLNTDNQEKNAIASALVEQVHAHFDYVIEDCKTEGYSATVTATITSFDCDSILASHKEALDAYLASTNAVIDGSEKRQQKSHQILLECIEENNATFTSEAKFHLINDGVSWTLENASDELGSAIFGTLVSSPEAVSESNEASS